MTRSREAILRLFRVADNRAGEIKPQSSIFPAYTASVVRKADGGERELVPMSWKFVLPQQRDQWSWKRGTLFVSVGPSREIRDDPKLRMGHSYWRARVTRGKRAVLPEERG